MRYCPIKIDLQTESKETESEAQQENTEGAEAQQQQEEEPNLREFTLIISRLISCCVQTKNKRLP